MDIFNLEQLDAQDEALLIIKHPTTDEPTGWTWSFYGPAHPLTIELANRASREALRDLAAQRQARINGKKWKDEAALSPDQLRLQNVETIVARTRSFSPVKLGAETIEFSADSAKKLLLDRKKGWLLAQIVDFLKDEENFIQPSATA